MARVVVTNQAKRDLRRIFSAAVGRNRFIAPLRGLVPTVDLSEAAQTAQCAALIAPYVLRHPEVRAKRASKDGHTHGLAAILRGPRKNAGTSG